MFKEKIFIVDDHRIVLLALKIILEENFSNFSIVEFSNSINLIVEVKKQKPKMIVFDFDMPGLNGIECAEMIKSIDSKIKILIFSITENQNMIQKFLTLGLDGFLNKSATEKQIQNTIQLILDGYKIFPRIDENNKLLNVNEIRTILTKKEFEVFKLICKGKTNREIGIKLEISKLTAEKHRANLIKKLNIKNSKELLMLNFDF